MRAARVGLDGEDGIGSIFEVGIAGIDAVDRESIASHFHDIARQADDPLHETGIVGLGIEHDDIAPLWLGETVDRNMGERDPCSVGYLDHEYSVALENRRFHLYRRKNVPVGERIVEHDNQNDKIDESLVFK